MHTLLKKGHRMKFYIFVKTYCIFFHIMIFLFISDALAAKYYIDATHGNDSNDGLSVSTAWRTISKVNNFTFIPGDFILLRRGDIWRENLILYVSGGINSPIVIDAYGTGSKPKILGSDSRTGTSYWVQESSGIWYSGGISWDPEMIFHEGVGSLRKNGKNILNTDWDWFYDTINKRIYIYLGVNPGNYSIEVQRRDGIGFIEKNNIHINNIEISYASTGIGLWGANYWVIDNVYIHDVTRCAIQGNNSSNFVTVQNSILQDWNWNGYNAIFGQGDNYKGYGITVLDTVSGSSSGNWSIINNIFNILNMKSGEDTTAINIDQQGNASFIINNVINCNNNTGSGIMIWRPKGSNPMVIKNNIINNSSNVGIVISDLNINNYLSEIVIENNTINNSCTADIIDQEALRIWTKNSAPIKIIRNLLNRTFTGMYPHYGIRVRNSTSYIFNNTIYGTDTGISIEDSFNVSVKNNISSGNRSLAGNIFNSSFVESNNNWNGKISGFIMDKNDINLDPVFVNTNPMNTGDFYLKSNSPCIDSGIDVGLPFLGSAPDIGFIDYIPTLKLPIPPLNIFIQ